jgi:2-desacetyl-2-hydroxyethyl bacteriochlorophyllide A dehydrogenase
MDRQALYFTKPRQVALRREAISAPAFGQVLVQTIISAISPGTESLIYRGQAPQDMARDDTIAALAGGFSFPLKYGYAVVGKVVTLGPGVSPDWQDRLVFAFHPHESHFLATPDELQMLPQHLTPEDAVFFPNLETAITFLLDGQPLVGEQVAIFGQGIVGLLLTALLARWPLNSLVTLDLYAKRRLLSESLGAHLSLDPSAPDLEERLRGYLQGASPYPGADLTYEISGNPQALNQAIAVTGFHGRVVIGSWYGHQKTKLNLGGRFHRGRLRLISSQVSTIPPELAGRWSKSRRYHSAWQILKEVKPARFITHRFPMAQAARAYELLDQHPEEAIQVILEY